MIRLMRPPRTKRASRVSAAPLLAATTLGVLALSPLGCASDSGRPSLIQGAGAAGNAGRAGVAGGEAGNADEAGASGADAGEAGEAGAPNNAAGNGGTANGLGGSSGNAPDVPASCSQSATWSESMAVPSISSAAKESLLSVTPDELDLAFLRGGALYVAHRASAAGTFVIGAELTLPAGWSAAHGATLSADGKRLILVSDPDQKQLGELTRANRSAAFSGEVDTSAFSAVNQDADFAGKRYASPAIAPTDDQLFFNSSFSDDVSTIVISSRTGTAPWGTPKELSPGTFNGTSGKRRLPSGVSADARTLFYFNEESAREEARWRSSRSASSALYDMLSLGARRGATPNSACNRLYSDADGDVVVEAD